ncbi:MAG: LytTR family transcriptional regulator [Butyricicoccus sp.]|nr:LytTR family transcriptional regulator [Butyricicoccus sp.]
MIALSVNTVPRPLCISVHRESLEIPVEDIVYIEVFNWKCVIHRHSGGSVSINTPLKKLAEQLVSPSFIRCGRSFLVNLSYLTAVKPDSLVLHGGTNIHVPRRERAELIPYCTRFLSAQK